MNWKALHGRSLFGDMKRGNPSRCFNARQVSATLVVSDLIYRFASGSSLFPSVPRAFPHRPIDFINSFVEIFEQVLEKVDTHGILDVDMAIILEDKPCDMGDHKFVFALTALMLKVSWELLEDSILSIQ
jgi:hypothetical protein